MYKQQYKCLVQVHKKIIGLKDHCLGQYPLVLYDAHWRAPFSLGCTWHELHLTQLSWVWWSAISMFILSLKYRNGTVSLRGDGLAKATGGTGFCKGEQLLLHVLFNYFHQYSSSFCIWKQENATRASLFPWTWSWGKTWLCSLWPYQTQLLNLSTCSGLSESHTDPALHRDLW